MERQPAPVVNHHAGRPGFSGPIGLVVGLGMYVTGRRRARTVAELVAVGATTTWWTSGAVPALR